MRWQPLGSLESMPVPYDVAMGRCLHDARHGYFFAAEPHRCADHSAEVRTKPEAPA